MGREGGAEGGAGSDEDAVVHSLIIRSTSGEFRESTFWLHHTLNVVNMRMKCRRGPLANDCNVFAIDSDVKQLAEVAWGLLMDIQFHRGPSH